MANLQIVPPQEMEGKCARCRKISVTIHEDTAVLARTCNHDLKKRGLKILGRNEVVLCPACYQDWRRERVSEGEKLEGRMHRDWQWWKTTARERGIEQADSELPDEWRKDFSFGMLRTRWISWWQTMKGKGGKGGTV